MGVLEHELMLRGQPKVWHSLCLGQQALGYESDRWKSNTLLPLYQFLRCHIHPLPSLFHFHHHLHGANTNPQLTLGRLAKKRWLKSSPPPSA